MYTLPQAYSHNFTILQFIMIDVLADNWLWNPVRVIQMLLKKYVLGGTSLKF